MKIIRLTVYIVKLDAWNVGTRYSATDKLGLSLQSSIVRLETDSGLIGWGETLTPPPFYHPTSPESARAAIGLIAPLVLGADPSQNRRILHDIRSMMRGHEPAKSVIDMAVWDLAGKVAGLPLVELWGGRVVNDMPVLCLVNFASPEEQFAQIVEFRAQGYKLFQIKVGDGDPNLDVARIEAGMSAMQPGERCWFDANRAWNIDQAMQILNQVKHLAPLIEQPTETYRDCVTISRRTGLGLMLDEVIHDQDDLFRAVNDGVIDVAVLKLGTTGGISEHRHLADVGVRLGIPMRIEDYYGTGLTLAAVCHLAHTLPEHAVFGLYDYHLPEVPVVKNPFPVVNGRVRVPDDCQPGLGVEVNPEVLGDPVAEYEL